MKLIVEISDEIKSKISQMGLYRLTKNDIETVSKSISHGTQLPKGHGRLIDADDFFDEFCEIAIEPYINAQTIIEADKEGEE